MGDDQQRQPELLAQVREDAEDEVARRGVERAHRLVADEQAGSHHHGARDRHPLALPTGDLAGPAVDEARFETDQLEGAPHRLATLFDTQLVLYQQALPDDLADRHVRVQRAKRVLEDELHRP